MEFFYDISADSNSGARRDAYSETPSSRFRRTLSLGIMTGPRPPFQGDSSRGRLPRAEAHGLFCFRPSGDPKCPNLQRPERAPDTSTKMTTYEKPDDCKEQIRSKLARNQGVHCQQARVLAEYAADAVKRQLPDRQQRLDRMVAQAKTHGFNLAGLRRERTCGGHSLPSSSS